MFAEYVSGLGRARKDIAKELQISEPYLSLLLSGAKVPSMELAVRIRTWSEGVVSCDSWVPDAKGAAA